MCKLGMGIQAAATRFFLSLRLTQVWPARAWRLESRFCPWPALVACPIQLSFMKPCHPNLLNSHPNCCGTVCRRGRGDSRVVCLHRLAAGALLAQPGAVSNLLKMRLQNRCVTQHDWIKQAWLFRIGPISHPRLTIPSLLQWEQQWGAECSSMLFELPHFALELLVVLPCVQVGRGWGLVGMHACLDRMLAWCGVEPCSRGQRSMHVTTGAALTCHPSRPTEPCPQIFCGRLRVMAQPHIRDPLPAPAADGNGPAAGEGWEAAEGAAGPAAEGAAAEGAAGAAGGPAAAAAAAEQQLGDCWVPDVMRCRWRRDPAQRRLLPRLKANLRSLALSALIIAGGLGRACVLCCVVVSEWFQPPGNGARFADHCTWVGKGIGLVAGQGGAWLGGCQGGVQAALELNSTAWFGASAWLAALADQGVLPCLPPLSPCRGGLQQPAGARASWLLPNSRAPALRSLPAVAASNSLLVPLALEARPAASQR